MKTIHVSVFGDSHLSPIHYFQSSFLAQMQEKTSSRYRFDVRFFAKSGAKLNNQIISEIKDRMDRLSNQPHVIVIGYGGNNIRKQTHGDDVLEGISQLLSAAKPIKRLQLVVLGIIPDPENLHLNQTFLEVDSQVRRLVLEQKQSFVPNLFLRQPRGLRLKGQKVAQPQPLNQFFAFKNNKIDIHLNQSAAEKLAERTAQIIEFIPKKMFD